jgi:hypothetical protein
MLQVSSGSPTRAKSHYCSRIVADGEDFPPFAPHFAQLEKFNLLKNSILQGQSRRANLSEQKANDWSCLDARFSRCALG